MGCRAQIFWFCGADALSAAIRHAASAVRQE
jgi:hypothetical protein